MSFLEHSKDDIILGGLAADFIDGGAGNNRLSATGAVETSLSGGGGSDTFVLAAQQYQAMLPAAGTMSSGIVAAKATEITDFTAGSGGDVLDVSELLKNAVSGFDGANPFAGGYLQLVQSGTDTLVQFDADGSAGTASALKTVATLRGVTASQFTSANFNPGFTTTGVLGTNHLPTGVPAR